MNSLERLAREQQRTPAELLHDLAADYEKSHRTQPRKTHSVLDIRPRSVGCVLKPLKPDDLLEEMLDGRHFV